MKEIREMSVDEMAAEIRSYPFRKDRGYAFISYSHRDRERVYPLVLSWLRAGYNIYIDLDFERHGSDSNWADLMLATLSSRLCRLGICFKSTHYRYSYASLLELLTMRGETVTNRHSGKSLYVDSVALETIPDEDEIPEYFKDVYAESFQSMRNSMGEEFLGQNRKEADLLREGLRFWLEEAGAKNALRTTLTAEKMMNYIQDAYLAGYQDFFPQIAYLVKNWFISQDLNGNDYLLSSSLSVRLSRFDEVRVERVRESLLPQSGSWVSRADPPVGESAPIQRVVPVLSPVCPDSRADQKARPRSNGDVDSVPRLVRISTEETILLHKGSFKLGRSAVCDYQITGNSAVGRIHAILFVRDEFVSIVDQHSKNFTRLNERVLQPDREYRLQEGDVIRISSETFVFHW